MVEWNSFQSSAAIAQQPYQLVLILNYIFSESLDDLAKQFKTKYAPQTSTATATYFRRMADIEDKFYT